MSALNEYEYRNTTKDNGLLITELPPSSFKNWKDETPIFKISNMANSAEVGKIKWNPTQQQFCFYPAENTALNSGSMAEILDVLNDEMVKQYEQDIKRASFTARIINGGKK